jgi:hypothetical protein
MVSFIFTLVHSNFVGPTSMSEQSRTEVFCWCMFQKEANHMTYNRAIGTYGERIPSVLYSSSMSFMSKGEAVGFPK